VEVEYDKNDSRLIKIFKINEDDERPVAPPFSILYFEIQSSSSHNLGLHLTDPIREIRSEFQEEPELSYEAGEDYNSAVCEYDLDKDPDILLSSNQHSRGKVSCSCQSSLQPPSAIFQVYNQYC